MPPMLPPEYRAHPLSHSHLFQNLGGHLCVPNVFISLVLQSNKQDCYNCNRNTRYLRESSAGRKAFFGKVPQSPGKGTPGPTWLIRGHVLPRLPFMTWAHLEDAGSLRQARPQMDRDTWFSFLFGGWEDCFSMKYLLRQRKDKEQEESS